MNNKYVSRRLTPWDSYGVLTPLESFLMMHYRQHYKDRHVPLTETEESELINSTEITCCRFCDSAKIKKSGFTKNHIQRYQCLNCGRSFTPTKGTIFENHKLSVSEWIEFLLNLFGYESMNQISKNNKNAVTTTKLWLEKVFLLLRDCQNDILLEGKVYIDETFYKVQKKDVKHRPDGLEYRGLSFNQYCIGVGYDGSNVLAFVQGAWKDQFQQNKEMLFKTYQRKITFDS